MACASNLSSSVAVVAKLTPSQASPSLSPANNKRTAAVHSPHTLQTSRFSLHINDNHRLRISVVSRGIPSATARSAALTAPDSHRCVSIPPIAVVAKLEPLKIMISGAPASGKGTQCELIKKKYGLVHIAAGDLLREEVAAGTENGRRAKEYMEKGMLVPDEIVVMMVKEHLLQSDAKKNGWLLDGYPRSLSQEKALEDLGIRPELFILLDVSEGILIERVVGRRLDPVTGRIYHLKYSPPENEEIAARLTQRFDDTEEKVKLRLLTHHQNVEAVLAVYKDITFKVNGIAPKEEVFAEIDKALSSILEKKSKLGPASMASGMAH